MSMHIGPSRPPATLRDHGGLVAFLNLSCAMWAAEACRGGCALVPNNVGPLNLGHGPADGARYLEYPGVGLCIGPQDVACLVMDRGAAHDDLTIRKG